jgi:methylenetetrahydrofolate reductase (NADPH)
MDNHQTLGEPVFSCELFPPRSDTARHSFRRELKELLKLPFQLFTCTHGANGSHPNGTAETLSLLKRRGPSELELAAHVCCRGSTAEELRVLVERVQESGARSIVALRGDRESLPGRGFQNAYQLVSFLKAEYPDLKVIVAGYPETHPEASSPHSDLIHLRQKIDCGAEAVFTQFFFDNHTYFRFCRECRAHQIEVPIIPGILPISSLEQIERLSKRCGASVPEGLRSHLSEAEDQEKAGLDFTIRQVKELLQKGVPGLHFYCLNRARAVTRIFEALGHFHSP